MIKRRLILAERIMYVNSGTPLNCVFTARIKGEITLENLIAALAKIQQKHPLLRAAIDDNDTKTPFFFLKADIEVIPIRIVQRQTDEDWLSESKTEWSRLFDDKNSPFARVVWVKGEEISEILLIAPHCICDGSAGMTLIRELLCLLDDPGMELEPYSMFGSIDEYLPSDFYTKKQRWKAKIVILLARCLFFIRRKSKETSSGENYVIHQKLDAEMTRAIIHGCKEAGITVHARLCAAFLQAFWLVRGSAAKGKVISPVDIRNFIPEIKQDHLFAFAPTVELSLKKNSLDLLDNAKQIKNELTRKMQKIKAREMLWMAERMHPLAGDIISMLKTSAGGHDMTLSNMGKINIPNQFKDFELETVFSPTVAFPWRNSNTLVTTTFKEQMDFTFMSNEQFLSREEAMKIKDKAVELLNLPI
ncbi:MAG: phthiocerol/phthiodiolone dimycocerosyl transferase family protein [Sphingobacterium sp.]